VLKYHQHCSISSLDKNLENMEDVVSRLERVAAQLEAVKVCAQFIILIRSNLFKRLFLSMQ
jgi:hypothetical protein